MNQDRIPVMQTDPLVTKTLERNNKPVKMISGENLLNDNDPIKPSHYRKGEIDLYESWYRTYPFNEFRAGMQMIAERYMKRDKDNRIQDLDKAIYTLSRLKEYEEFEKSDIEQALDDLKNGNINTFESVEDLMNELEEEQ